MGLIERDQLGDNFKLEIDTFKNDFDAYKADNVNKFSEIEIDITDLQTNKAAKTEVNSLASAKADVAYVDTKVAAVASGSPAGTFSTLSALQADSTANTVDGKKRTYVVLADGKWYYWNSSAWTPGGSYQSTGIGDKTIKYDSLDDDARAVVYDIQKISKPLVGDIHIANGVVCNYNYDNEIFTWSNKTQGDFVVPYILCDAYKKVSYINLGATYTVIGLNSSNASNNVFLLMYLTSTEIRLQRMLYSKTTGLNGGINTITTISNTNAITLTANDEIVITNSANVINLSIVRGGVTYNILSNINLNTVDSTYAYNFVAGNFNHTNTVFSTFKNVKLYSQSRYEELKSDILELESQIIDIEAGSSSSLYYNKVGNFVGDSITAGSNGGTSYVPTVHQILKLASVVNNGTGGITVGGLISIANTVITNDFILVFSGTNDFGGNTVLGQLGDTINGQSFYGTFYSLLQRFSTNSPGVPIGVITPIPRFDKSTNDLGLTLEDYVNAEIATCKKLGLPYLDLYHESGFNSFNYTHYYLADKVHLNTSGGPKIGKEIAQFTNTKVL